MPFEQVLQLKLGITPVPGILPADITVKIRKQGDPTFTTKVMNSSNFYSLGNGYYVLAFSGADLSVMGDFFFSISGLAFDTINSQFGVGPIPQELVIIPPSVCNVMGNLRDLSSSPMRDMQVTFRAVNYPLQSGLSVITADKVLARTDSQGNFSAPLIRGMTVMVEVERTGLRNQFVVPDAPTALLNDLINFPI